MKLIKMLTMTLLLAILPSCGLTLGPVAERQTVWAKMGTSGKIVSDTDAELLVEVDGKLARSRANVQGMIVLDEPTYEVMLKQWKARQMVDVDVKPGVKP
jgi:uncharacterized membrane protein YvbJ